jgi:hypothetical protein
MLQRYNHFEGQKKGDAKSTTFYKNAFAILFHHHHLLGDLFRAIEPSEQIDGICKSMAVQHKRMRLAFVHVLC